MTQQREAHAVISRELVRIGRLPTSPVHRGYAAIVAKAHTLGLPQRHATDITIHDRLLIAGRQPRQFAWLLHSSGSLLSLPEPNQRPLDYLHATRRRQLQRPSHRPTCCGRPVPAAVRSYRHHAAVWTPFPARSTCAAPSVWR
jgi:hypothetical protein